MHAFKHQSFLQVDFNTLGITFFCKVILSLLMGIIKDSESTQSNKFAISLQYLKKEVRDRVHFLHADKNQSFYKLALLCLVEVARHVQSTQNRKLVIFLQYLQKKNIDKVYFLRADKHVGCIWTDLDKAPIAIHLLQYLKKDVRNEVDFFAWK